MRIQNRKGLQYIIFDLQPGWEKEARLLAENLKKDGVSCICMTQTNWEPAKWDRLKTVVLTDSVARGKELARMGIVYFGCSHTDILHKNFTYTNSCQGCVLSGEIEPQKTTGDLSSGCLENSDRKNSGKSWFDGAALVLEGFDGIDARYLEEWMLRTQGLPAVIARTERLEIREMAEQDLPEMIRIGNESGAVENLSGNADMFSEERLSSYIKTAYRLQGYGLWSVLHEGKLIGCCGFAPWDTAEIAQADSEEGRQLTTAKEGSVESVRLTAAKEGSVRSGQLTVAAAYRIFRLAFPVTESEECQIMMQSKKSALELQYMLDRAYRRQGFGTEMCQAALEYAYERLDADKIYLRIRLDNQASRALAKKLHFTEQQDIV